MLYEAQLWNLSPCFETLIPHDSCNDASIGRLSSSCLRSLCHYSAFLVCACVSVCVCLWLSLCEHVCELIHTCTFVAHPQCQHPNHNYNVISRVWQCPCCCFTSTSFSLPWIPNAVTLSVDICTALFQAHMFNICALCSMEEMVGLGVGGGWAEMVVEEMVVERGVWQKKTS